MRANGKSFTWWGNPGDVAINGKSTVARGRMITTKQYRKGSESMVTTFGNHWIGEPIGGLVSVSIKTYWPRLNRKPDNGHRPRCLRARIPAARPGPGDGSMKGDDA